MKARNENGTIVVYSEEQMKQKFNRFQLEDGSDVNLFYASAKEVLEEYGFFDFVLPPLAAGERYGEKYKDEVNNVFTCYVEQIPPKTDTEIKSEVKNNSEFKKQELIRVKMEKMIVEEAQTLTSNSEIIENKDLFPFWEVGMVLKLDQKVQAFNILDLKLYKVVQAHTTQTDWQPFNNPALFTEIAPPGQVPIWKQPTGAQDAYAINAAISFEGKYYKSKIAANTYSPTAYPAGWQEITLEEAQLLV